MTPRPVQTPAPGTLKVQGQLARDAESRHTLGTPSHALIVAELTTGCGLPCLVQQDLGTEPSAHMAADSKARLLRRGMHATAWARGAEPRTDHDRAVLRLLDVSDLIPHDLPESATAR